MREIMLLQLFSLYFESLILTTILVLIFLGIWIGLRAMSGVDKTAKARQAMSPFFIRFKSVNSFAVGSPRCPWFQHDVPMLARTVCSCTESKDCYEVFLYQMLLLFNY